ncbi:hypothetical protein TL16_g09567 [Triparma laevis f. inornata]|uniref:Uncharacterized protein n=1 Tax=Triparma laevis f. inornata TaxID=1714386 RepID=A0A9W7BAP3_9STRA|nr:hypothetical protein TL16_g09567 [Triparma laevis f. inornata]
MSKFIATESKEGHESRGTSGKRGARDEGNEDEEGILGALSAATSSTLTTVSTAPATTDQFMFTDDFKWLLVELVMGDTLMTLRLATKAWKRVVHVFIDEGVRSGAMIVHGGKDISSFAAWARSERMKLVKRVFFLLNVMTVGKAACMYAVNLVVVDIPEGIESIGEFAFGACQSLTTVSFPTTLASIGQAAFRKCFSLDNVDLFHTNLRLIDICAFEDCSELKSMTIPGSLQTLGPNVFYKCFKLVPSNIDINDEINEDDVSSDVVAHLRLQQLLAGNNFLTNDDFRRLIVPYLQNDTLMTIRLASKPWSRVVDAFIDDGVESGKFLVHGGNDISWTVASARDDIEIVTRIIFLLNVVKVGDNACKYAENLVVVEIPEGVVSISERAFHGCKSLTTVSFPTTLTSVERFAFAYCENLDDVDLLHTNLQELGDDAFQFCSELKSMTIPDSLQTLGWSVFWSCFNLVPSNINVEISGVDNNGEEDPTSEVIAYLRSQQ